MLPPFFSGNSGPETACSEPITPKAFANSSPDITPKAFATSSPGIHRRRSLISAHGDNAEGVR